MPNAYACYREEIAKCNTKDAFIKRNMGSSNIQSNNGIEYRQIDLDSKNIDNVRAVNDLLTKLEVPMTMCIETRGGFHILFLNNINIRQKSNIYLGIYYSSLDE